jgi:hypothetical protein
MIVLTTEEAAVFELLDPSSSRRLVLSRTGKAFVWDPITSTKEVPYEAAQSLVSSGVVAGGRIAPAHVALWRQPAPQPKAAAKKVQRLPAPAAAVIHEPAEPPVSMVFDKTLPLGITASSLQAMG